MVVRGAQARTFSTARFATDFNVVTNVPAEVIERTRAEAQATGYAEGWAQGREEARQAAAAEVRDEAERVARAEARKIARLESALAAITASADRLERQTAPAAAEIEELIVQTAYTLAEAVLGREIAHSPEPGREALTRALELVPENHPVLVRLSPADHAAIVGAGQNSFDMDGRNVTMVVDARLKPGDAVAECDATAVDARLSTALDRVKEALGL
ncbi:flagellar assembly protein [Planomonospora sp. ID67723]|uniref:FliH/SctL family protein n=1 Tax=Planomonospora sp. ID67723 TaxID=2738134 RepID=UPI0018C35788|nr:FliH/SctL family protein [Planomonospora sp. ID67723]MBG0833312.1 flagellar assembly protein [Planomonospora sp. ID67723]